MIPVKKPATPPKTLRERGQVQRKSDEALYDSSPRKYRDGSKKFEFSSGIYGTTTVKSALKKAQHDKCAFCESKISHISYGDVEHFRPKGAWRQDMDDEQSYPGYYWLAYQWENLFLACQICNQRFKKDLFPLENPSRRARSHRTDVAREKPLFLDPGKDDPSAHIGFRQEYLFAKNDSPRGQSTIDMLGINRAILAERRRDHIEQIRLISALANSDLPESQEARDYLQRAVTPKAEYSAATSAFLSEPEV